MDSLHPLIFFPTSSSSGLVWDGGMLLMFHLWLSTPQTRVLYTLICGQSLRYLPSTAQRSFSDVGLEFHKSMGTDMFIEK